MTVVIECGVQAPHDGVELGICRAALGKRAPYALVRVPRLPRNPAGKVLRQLLAERTRFLPSGSVSADTMPPAMNNVEDPERP